MYLFWLPEWSMLCRARLAPMCYNSSSRTDRDDQQECSADVHHSHCRIASARSWGTHQDQSADLAAAECDASHDEHAEKRSVKRLPVASSSQTAGCSQVPARVSTSSGCRVAGWVVDGALRAALESVAKQVSVWALSSGSLTLCAVVTFCKHSGQQRFSPVSHRSMHSA